MWALKAALSSAFLFLPSFSFHILTEHCEVCALALSLHWWEKGAHMGATQGDGLPGVMAAPGTRSGQEVLGGHLVSSGQSRKTSGGG